MKARKTKRRLNVFNLITVIFVFTMMLYMASSLLLKSVNVSLASKTAQANKTITILQSEVDTISAEVKELSDYNRVVAVLDTDMNKIDTTVITVAH